MPSASPAYRSSLQQRRTFSRRRCARHFISLTVGLENFEILLKSLPADVAGMSIRDASQPVIVVTLPLHGLFAVDGSSVAPPSIDVGARVSRIVQACVSPSMRSVAERPIVSLLRRREGNRRPSFRKTLTVWHAEPTRENVSKK